jgi:hypothetical protein
MLRAAFGELDRILRGEATRLDALREAPLAFPFVPMATSLVLLAAVAGACTGSYAVFRPSEPEYPYLNQLAASTVKVPLLFLLTLVVTFPSLYVFNALMGSRLALVPVLRLLVAALGVIVAVLASLGPIVAFFAVSTTSYPFMVLMNVVVYGVSGVLGLAFLLRTLHRLSFIEHQSIERLPPPLPDGTPLVDESRATGPLDRFDHPATSRHVALVFRAWIVVFGLVGAQMAWVLRPFIGNPHQPFAWFRARRGNFFEAVAAAIQALLIP